MVFRFILISIFASAVAHATSNVIAPSGTEVSFRYSAEFIFDETTGEDEYAQADLHSNYLFGVLHSPHILTQFGLNPADIEGIGGASVPINIQIQSVKEDASGEKIVSYSASGRILLNNKVLSKTSSLTVRLPYDFSKTYLKKCTDSHYTSLGDYWYFWDPYRQGCEKLTDDKVTHEVTLQLKAIASAPHETSPNLKQLRGDNGNGEVLSVYILNGFSESSQDAKDEGRAGFAEVQAYFEDAGYTVENVDKHRLYPRNRYTKRLSDTLVVEVNHQLSNTDIGSSTITFPKVFKEAAEKGDIIVYLGHSGLGGNLDIPSLNLKLENAGEKPIDFKKNKYQIFYFDSCSSYSYYLPTFRALKPQSKIDIISYGLSTYFATSGPVFSILMDKFLNVDPAETWNDILKAMEKPIGKSTYLLNVGGV